MGNIDFETVSSFGSEWTEFDQSLFSNNEFEKIFREYFSIFPWEILPEQSVGFDMGCGSGRWAKFVSPKVGKLHCIDPSAAIEVARSNLIHLENIIFHQASVDSGCLPPESQDFGYSLGVLHHVPDTLAAIKSCVEMLKPGAPLLLYLYYSFENRSIFFKIIWKCSDILRIIICRLPNCLKSKITDLIALLVYLPFAYLSKFLEWSGLNTSSLPLSYYRNHSFYTMRTDSRDRFGTPLEKRFSKKQIVEMMTYAGLRDIKFSEVSPFWCVVGYKV